MNFEKETGQEGRRPDPAKSLRVCLAEILR